MGYLSNLVVDAMGYKVGRRNLATDAKDEKHMLPTTVVAENYQVSAVAKYNRLKYSPEFL